MLRTGYYIDDYQATYFVIDSFEDLFDLLKGRDFTAEFERLRTEQPYSPFEDPAAGQGGAERHG